MVRKYQLLIASMAGASALLACAANQSDESGPTGATGLTIDDVLREATGYSAVEIQNAGSALQLASTADCMTKRGFSFSPPNDLQSATRDDDRYFGGQIQQLYNAISKPAGTEDSNSADPAQHEALAFCLDQAAVPSATPLAGFTAWLAQATEDVVTGAKTDHEVVKADQERLECMQAIGLEDDDVTSLNNEMVGQANDIAEMYFGGALTRGEALARLEPLLERENALAPDINTCFAAHRVVYDRELDERLSNFIDEHIAAIKDKIAEIDIGSLSTYLPDQ